MNIIVCVKCVPLGCLEKAGNEKGLEREKTTQALNPYDLYALEAALEIRDKTKEETKVTVLSMGPATVNEVLKQIYYMGVDRVILLSDKVFSGADTLATSYTLQKAIETIGNFDLILCGQQSADGDTGQVGPMLANNLHIPFLTQIHHILEVKSDFILCDRTSDYECQTVKLPLPALICAKNRMNNPRTANLRSYFKYKNHEIETWNLKSINAEQKRCGQSGSATQVVEVYKPPSRQNCEFITGNETEVIDKIIKVIVQKGLLLGS